MDAVPLLRLRVENEASLGGFARALAPLLRRGDCIALTGTLGAGKTSFVRALVRTLSPTAPGHPPLEVTSPTFTLLQSYPVRLSNGTAELWHADLYRLESPERLEELGLHELPSQGLLCVEWPRIAQRWLPRQTLEMTLTLDPAMPEARGIVLFARPDSDWPMRVSLLAGASRV